MKEVYLKPNSKTAFFKAILKFCTATQLFMYFRQRYTKQQIAVLNDVVRTRGKIRTYRRSSAFLQKCICERVAPQFIIDRLERSRARHSPDMERAFLKDEIDRLADQSRKLRRAYQIHWRAARDFLSFFDMIRFCKYLSILDERTQRKASNQHLHQLASLKSKRFGNALSDTRKHILNLSEYELSDLERFVLSHGLNFGMPPKSVSKEQTFAEFESLWAQLQHHTPTSKEQRDALKARLADLAYIYCDSKIDTHDFVMQKECFSAINKLRRNNNLIITKPDKGSGVVILSKSDYIQKMNNILEDQTKFERVGPASSCDNTAGVESRLQKRLLELFKAKLLPESVYRSIRPTGSQRPRMYGLPKTHKQDVPLRPILSMTGSAHHELSKWLASLLQPVLDRFTAHCISDSFTFADYIRKLDGRNDSYMCSFDVSSLFTNVPLDETIRICADALYDNPELQPYIPKEVFVELMHSATSTVEFSFNDTIYRQIDGVAMGSPLGPALANIFVGYYEEKLFSDMPKPSVYFRYVDDTFAIFRNEKESEEFLIKLNDLHSSLKFTFEKEKNNTLPFLDVCVERMKTGYVTSVYRKPTFTGQYLRWESFTPIKRKASLVSTLVHRALRICSKSRLKEEINRIKSILLENGYPESFVLKQISKKITQFSSPRRFGPDKCPVYLRVIYTGKASLTLENNVRTAVGSCYGSVATRIVFVSKQMMPATRKDVLPANQKSSVVYEYKCHCDSRYVGRTSQRLQDRIKQHVPKWLKQQHTGSQRLQPNRACKKRRTSTAECESAIGQHLLDNDHCAANYNEDQFTILDTARSLFHLSVLEACYITVRRPNLCRQKEFVYTLNLFK